MPAKAKWTILTYIAAHNNIQHYGKSSYDQIIGVGSTSEIVHGILFDWPDGAARYIVGGPGKVLLQEQLGNYDSGDPVSLVNTAKWVFGQYPAEHYGLILWSHGSGWRPEELEEIARSARHDTQVNLQETKERAATPGSMAFFRTSLHTILKKEKSAERAICFDDGTGHSLDTLELNRVTNEIKSHLGQPLDFLGMDACLMASVELAYQVRNSVKYLVASEELVPGDSWPYNKIFGELRENPSKSGADLAVSVVNKYMDFYTTYPPPVGDVTVVALDLQQIEILSDHINVLSDALIADFDQHADILWNVQQKTLQKESLRNKRKPNKFDFHLWDVGTLAAGLAAEQSASEIIKRSASSIVEALQTGSPSILAEGHRGDWFDGIGGVSIYLVPPLKQRISPYYGDLSLSQDTRWIDLLNTYHRHYS